MSSQTQVRELFSLPKKEIIFDDFGCAFSKGILHQGRMYITENYICFYSSIMGISKKLIIPLNDVQKITKAKRLGMIKALKILQAGKKHSYKFQSFSDIDKTFKIIHKLWVNISPYAKDINQFSEEDNEKDDEVQSQSSFNTQLEKASFREGTTKDVNLSLQTSDSAVRTSQAQNGVGQAPNPTVANGWTEIRTSMAKIEELKEEGFDIVIEENQNSNKKERKGTNLSNITNEKDVSPSPLQHIQKRTLSHEGLVLDAKPSAGIQVEKAQGINEINAKESATAFDSITKEDLDKLLEPYPIPENFEEMERIFLGMSPKDFFNNVALHQGVHSLEKFYVERGEQKMSTQDWMIPDPAEEYDGRPVIQASQMSVEIQIKDNPFLKVSPTTKYFKLLELQDTKVQFKTLSKCTGVPYSDTFAIEEEWLVLSPSPNAPCCVARLTLQVIFYKSTIFKSKILTNAVKGAKAVWVEFHEWLKKRNVLFKEKKSHGVGKLKHGIEKSNKLFEQQKADNTAQQTAVLTFKDKVFNYYIFGSQWMITSRLEIMLVIIILILIQIYFKLCALEQRLPLMTTIITNEDQL